MPTEHLRVGLGTPTGLSTPHPLLPPVTARSSISWRLGAGNWLVGKVEGVADG